MSRATVRAAIATYLTKGAANGTIVYLSTVFQHPPKFTKETTFTTDDTPGTAEGAVIYLHLVDQHEYREAIGGPHSGKKMRVYLCGLICVLRSKKSESQTAGFANDDFLDSLTAYIEATRNAGDPSAIFQWGEGTTAGGNDIVVKAGMPRPIRQQMAQVFTTVEVIVLEELTT